MFHYLALAWNALDRAASDEARVLATRFQANLREWRCVMDDDGLIVFVRAVGDVRFDDLHLLPDGRGLVLGKLFERTPVTARTTRTVLDDRRAARIIDTGGRDLVESCWGRYVAFLRDPRCNRVWVLRDPAGTIPCQTTRLGRVHAYFVRLEDCERLGDVRRAVNRHYLLGYLMHDSVCVHETGLEGVETVLAGQCVEHAGDQCRRQFYWDPLQIAASGVIEDTVEAVAAMQSVVRICVHAWASCSDGIMHDLSGGLDSSIVLACLASAPSRPHVLCRHTYSNSGDLDERSLARLAAARVGARLIEEPLDPQFDLPPIELARGCLSPFPQLLDRRALRQQIQLMRTENLSLQFNGEGGDEVFYRTGPLPTAVDYAWRHGVDARMVRITADDAVYTRSSFWRTLRSVAHYGLRKQRWSLTAAGSSDRRPLMREEVKKEARRDSTLWHPLFRGDAQIEPCKFTQAYHFAFGAAHGYVPGMDERMRPCVAPLISQPVMELSLRIPAYVLMNGGRDRAVARAAFVAELPPQIFRRRAKGAGDGFLQDVLWRHIESARQLLLDGFLVNAGFLDRAQLEAVLSGEPTRITSSIVELAMYLDVEKWVQSQSSSPVRAVA